MLSRGTALLRDPALNQGTAFTMAERDALGLRGLRRPRVLSQEDQAARVLENFSSKTSDLEKYIKLAALHDRHEARFFRLVIVASRPRWPRWPMHRALRGCRGRMTCAPTFRRRCTSRATPTMPRRPSPQGAYLPLNPES